MIYKYNATKLLASELLTTLQDAFLSIRLSHPQCLRPTDLTPPTQGLQRSNLMHFAFSQSPVLLISGFAEKAAILLRQLSSTSDSSVRSSYFPIDAMATVEQLHFTCCRWFHRYSSNSHLNPDLSAPVPPTIPAPSTLDQLACGSNWTLQFHTLDSLLHPELVWKLTGHNSTVNPTQFNAVIVDQSAEAVYRLEEPVSYESLSQFISDYHASVLKPWFRHSRSRPSGSNPSHSSRSLFVTEIRSRSHLDHLLDERSHIHWATQASNTCCAHTSLILLYYTEACVFASQGESALWHFDVVARQFSTQAGVLFAKVDVSAVDLPWHLRVERVPSIIFFPASRSSYSIPFPSASMITHDLSSRLSNFLREQIGLPCVTVRTLDVDRTSLSARKHLLNILQSGHSVIPTEELARQLHNVCHNDSSTSSSIKRLTACQSSIRAVTSDYATKYKHAQHTASALLRYLYVNLNDLNSRLVSPFYRMLYATRGQRIHLISSLMLQSDLWNKVYAFERNVSSLLRLFSVSG
ncbi:Thioredoxin domain-containing protein 11 [Paragonimus heterotremus]|uniref:Thioredoxin domain-containing protein 11 n=1 Tax=Paragonimus heterotremus TaxID=100268 RepID=A0A8J4WQ51_9TREM|nr:Thioredoxin domain-containing protein 11 [Paragonimus heterotremus]